jgi:hypothetical protein
MDDPYFNLDLVDESHRVPTDKDLCVALMVAIGTHPLVQNAVVYDPTSPIDQKTPVKITKFRLYGGKEILTDELTLSLFPAPRSLAGGGASSSSGHFLSVSTQTLGPNYGYEGSDSMVARFHLELSFRSPIFDIPVELSYKAMSNSKDSYGPTDNLLYSPTTSLYSCQYDSWLRESSFTVTVLPAEEILRDWVSILRYVIRDIRNLRPYELRNPQISAVHYDSSGIFDQDKTEALVFHRATIEFQIRFSEGNFSR